ncbi:hypothetical protein L2Y96_19235 [Luteibacter aegosomaticola]|uniref:hypothetical protein n=1 Tax=Luteibacter aegosomaticola TaxID=2911538 RepID=UPI001FFA94EE|nr:hypothetical protein [Luteibacter aegosomaticola]UPG89507.1 hypothetical protein L2Y96_19235 [Luteibacter aegosomaticola]
MTEEHGKRQSGSALSALLPAVTNLLKASPSQQEVSISAGNSSVAVAGDNYGSICNISAQSVTLIERQIARELPSYLSSVVVRFSEDLVAYNTGPMRTLPPEVSVKLAYNDFPSAHYIITDYSKYSSVLESAYSGAEQRNDDARRMVRRRAAVAYMEQLHKLCDLLELKPADAHAVARAHAVSLVLAVVEVMLADFSSGSSVTVMQETAHLAVSLIVADAVIECEVLERPDDALAS